MKKSSKRQKKVEMSDSGSEGESGSEQMSAPDSEYEYNDNDASENELTGDDDDTNEYGGDKDAETEELEKELSDIRNKESLFSNLKRHKDDDVLKGQAVKTRRRLDMSISRATSLPALWDKTLEVRFLVQKAFSSSNRLPKERIKSSFCDSDNKVNEAYSELISSSKKTLDSLLELRKALLEKNPAVSQVADGKSGQHPKHLEASRSLNGEADEEWSQIYQMHSRIAPFRNKSIDKWQRKTQVATGAAAIKNKLNAFNKNISEQVADYMRDPTRMLKGMQQRRSTVAIFGTVADVDEKAKEQDEEKKGDGDPELLDDSEFYQQLLKEFFDTVDPTSNESAFYALKKMQTKKRKIVDRRASKSRKIRYNVHEKIVNFMAPQPVRISEMAPKLFQNLFGLKTQKPVSAK